MNRLDNKRARNMGRLILIWIGLLYISSPFSAFAAMDYSVETIPNVRLTDRFNHVSNPDQILAAEDVSQMNLILNALEDSLGIEVAVVAIEGIGENDARMFANDLFKHWGLGTKNEDNGLLIQLVTEPTQRSVVFETGYGIEGVLPDAICYRLQQRYMIPDLKAGNFSGGMLKGVTAVAQYLLASDYERAAMTGNNQNAQDEEMPWWVFAGMITGVLGIVSIVGYMKYRPRVCPRCRKKTLVYSGRHTIQEATYRAEGLVEDVYRCKNCGHTEKKRRTMDRLHRGGGGGPIIMGGGGFGRGGGFGGGGGGSWGGGSSGGGGSISRF